MDNCITTYTGIEIDPFHPEESKIDIRDIAHALSLLTRANGHFPQFFSVGQHSIQCCKEAIARSYPPEVAMACLIHDASEAYLADITRPVKKYMTMYLQIEEQLQNMIYIKYLGHVPEGEELVLLSNIDDACLYYEFKHFMHTESVPEPVLISKPSYRFVPMNDVEEEFLKLYGDLIARMAE